MRSILTCQVRNIEKSVFTNRYKLFLYQLRSERKKAGLSQTELAEKLSSADGQSANEAQRQLFQLQRFVSRCETGDRRVDITELWIICNALGISFTDFARTLDESLKAEAQRE